MPRTNAEEFKRLKTFQFEIKFRMHQLETFCFSLQDVIPEGMNSAEMSVAAFEKLVAPYRMSVNRWCSICHLRDPESNEGE